MRGIVTLILLCAVRAQPATRKSSGASLALDMAWAGLVYGMLDALFLNIMPVIAVWIGMAQFTWAATLAGKIGIGFISLIASLLVTLTYHLGYPEFRNKSVAMVLLGNLGVVRMLYQGFQQVAAPGGMIDNANFFQRRSSCTCHSSSWDLCRFSASRWSSADSCCWRWSCSLNSCNSSAAFLMR